jgi:hypothetical protein
VNPCAAATVAHHGEVRTTVPSPIASDMRTLRQLLPNESSIKALLNATNGAVPRWLSTVRDANSVAHAVCRHA